jgi:peptidoglycan biosynthesis protein MviN/MurJ (putative lipid II flippase)
VAAVVAVVAGILALVLGWLGISDALYPGQQIPYIISGGLVGVVCIAVGIALWLSADLRDEWRKLDDVDAKLAALLGGEAASAPSALTGSRSA